MSRTDTSTWPCPIARSVDVLGDSWNLLILRQAFTGIRRFDQFQSSLGIGRAILTSHLNQLVDESVLARVQYQDRPARFEYRLTDKGRSAYSVIAALAAWGDEWLSGPEGSPVALHHITCDHDMVASVVCGHCGDPLHARDVRAHAGPGHPSRAPRSDPEQPQLGPRSRE